jgi:AraC-like DNA-binding protein
MNRRAFPEFGMSESQQEDLRQQGIVVIPFMDSLAQDPQRLRPHYHDFFQIFILVGQAEVMHDFQEFTANGNTIVFMTPGQVHTAQPAKGMRGTTVSFTQAFFDGGTPPPSRLFDYPFFFPAEAKPWLTVPHRDAAPIVEMFAELQREFNAGQAGAAEVLRAQLHILLVRMDRLYARLHPRRHVSRAGVLARQFHLYVEQNFRTMHEVADYARLLDVTPNHLHDLVREEVGVTAGYIIRARRLLDAKRQLSHSDLDVSEIAYDLGFKDPSYFSRFFRRETRLTPAEFRAEIREKYQR